MSNRRELRLRRETLTALRDEDLGGVDGGAEAPTQAPYTICYLYQCPGTFAAGCQIVRPTAGCGE